MVAIARAFSRGTRTQVDVEDCKSILVFLWSRLDVFVVASLLWRRFGCRIFLTATLFIRPGCIFYKCSFMTLLPKVQPCLQESNSPWSLPAPRQSLPRCALWARRRRNFRSRLIRRRRWRRATSPCGRSSIAADLHSRFDAGTRARHPTSTPLLSFPASTFMTASSRSRSPAVHCRTPRRARVASLVLYFVFRLRTERSAARVSICARPTGVPTTRFGAITRRSTSPTRALTSPAFVARLRRNMSSYVDLVPGEWTAMRIEVSGATAKLFVGAGPQPVLIVNDLKRGADAHGSVGLYVDNGTDGHFRNLRVRPFL